MKNLSFIGAGYVGLCNGVGFASLDNKVFLVDIDEEKVRTINSAISPIYEAGLENLLKNVLTNMNLKATNSLKYAIENSDITFICVQTSSKFDGSINLKYIKKAAMIEAEPWFEVKYDKVNNPTYHLNVHPYMSSRVSPQEKCKQCGGIMGEHGWIETLEGGHIVCPFDWIIKGINGEIYPIKNDIFLKTYDVV